MKIDLANAKISINDEERIWSRAGFGLTFWVRAGFGPNISPVYKSDSLTFP